ncbi:hypothetical protein ACFV3R_14745 [Streptomyces sp. NPDC059740]|uniref:hypothetical protein n=1 Tax=Streptomyces sp. NPDC059740 TaxID=3346926 RepID=UPI00364FB8E2
MADHQPDAVADALRTLGVSRAQLRDANRRWQALAHSPRAGGGLRRYRSHLGPPAETGLRRVGDLTCRVHRWPVPLWPTLRFEVLTAEDGAVWNAWLVRAPGAPAPVLRSVTDLRPWSATVDEVARAFAPARPMEGSAPTRWNLAFTAPEGPGGGPGGGAGHGDRPLPRVAEFTWGLFQRLLP